MLKFLRKFKIVNGVYQIWNQLTTSSTYTPIPIVPDVDWYVRRAQNDKRFIGNCPAADDPEKYKKHLQWLWIKQRGRCAFSGVRIYARYDDGDGYPDWVHQKAKKMGRGGSKKYRTPENEIKSPFLLASIDRIDNSKGYGPGNVIWTSECFNLGRNDHTISDFRKYYEQYRHLTRPKFYNLIWKMFFG